MFFALIVISIFLSAAILWIILLEERIKDLKSRQDLISKWIGSYRPPEWDKGDTYDDKMSITEMVTHIYREMSGLYSQISIRNDNYNFLGGKYISLKNYLDDHKEEFELLLDELGYEIKESDPQPAKKHIAKKEEEEDE